jgi:hypothetical protein
MACKRGRLAIGTERSRDGRLVPVQGRSVRSGVRPPAPAVAIGPISAVAWSTVPAETSAPSRCGLGALRSDCQKGGWSLKSPPRSACRSRP